MAEKYTNDSEELDRWIRACYMDPQPSYYQEAPAADTRNYDSEEYLEGNEYHEPVVQKTNLLEALEETKQFVNKLLGKKMDGYDSCGVRKVDKRKKMEDYDSCGVRKLDKRKKMEDYVREEHQPPQERKRPRIHKRNMDFMWEGLACPPLDEYAFNFDTPNNFTLDDILDHPSLESDQVRDDYHKYIPNYTKEDQELDKNVAWCLTHKPTPPTEDYFHLLDQVPAKKNIIKIKNYPPRGRHCKGKELKAILALKPTSHEQQIKATQVEPEPMPILKKSLHALNRTRADEKQNNKRKTIQGYDCQLVIDNKIKADNDLRLEATSQKLHQSYQRFREAKQQKKIQVIDFQKPQPKSKAKSNLRQKLLAMGKRKSYKKFQSFVY